MTKLHFSRSLAAVAGGFCCALLLNAPGTALAEGAKIEFPAPSAHCVVKQRVGVTDVEIDYSRPNKNGRDVFGGLVPWNAVWRTGANASTKITFSDAVNLGGKEVPAGKYGLYTIPTANEWTVILSKEPDQWGAYTYKEAQDLTRFTVKPETLAAPVETFTIDFADVKEGAASLCLAWDRTRVSVPLTVDTLGKMKAELPRAAAAPDAKPEFFAQAANYYLSHDFDLPKALEWINTAIEKSPATYAYTYAFYERKARIQAKLGDKPAALASMEKAITMAKANPAAAPAEEIADLTKFATSLR